MSDFGFWDYAGKNGLEGAASTIVTMPDGSKRIVKDPENPCVLEDEFILFAIRNNEGTARDDFERLLPLMNAVSQKRLNGLKADHADYFVHNPTSADTLQSNQVKAGVHVDLKHLQRGVIRQPLK